MENTHSKNQLVSKYPASWWRNMWREALPAGNGTIGVSVYGGVKDETILMNHGALWHLGQKKEVPDVSHTLEETRNLMEEKKYLEASWNLTNALKEQGYQTRLASRLPLAALKLSMFNKYPFKNYRRTLNMETGEVTVNWAEDKQSYRRRLFVSRSNDTIVYEVDTTHGELDGELTIGLQESDGRRIGERYPHLVDHLEIYTKGQYLYYATQNDDGSDFGAVVRIVPYDNTITSSEETIQFSHGTKLLMLIKIFVKGEREREWLRLSEELSLINDTYDQLLQEHLPIHEELFFTSTLALAEDSTEVSNEELLLEAYEGEAPTRLIEKLWAYGRYLFISGTSPDSQPFGLYGLWYGDYRLMWGHHMANENIQMMYWHAPVGGLIEYIPAMYDYYAHMMEDFRRNARNLYGCRGIFIPAGTTPGIGTPNQIVPVIMNWTGAAGWLAKHFYDYYLYTGDEVFLREKALPFMSEAALFFEDFLVEGEDGYIKFYPSVSPENTPQNFMPEDDKHLAHPMPTTINATVDFAILKELLKNLIEGSKQTGENKEKISKWQEMLSKIPAYQFNDEGAIREWMHPEFEDRYDHRHLSHIYPVFPGQEFTREEEPELFQGFETAVRKRLIGAQTGWSLAHMASIYARLEDGDSALECLDILARSCLLNNFFTLHNDWRDMGICMNSATAPVQMDANLGIINAVQEMLLYVSPSILKLLPALPRKWKKGQVEKFRFTTGHISFEWNTEDRYFQATIEATRLTKCTIKLPDFCNGYSFVKGEAIGEISTYGENYYKVHMEAGNHLVIRSIVP